MKRTSEMGLELRRLQEDLEKIKDEFNQFDKKLNVSSHFLFSSINLIRGNLEKYPDEEILDIRRTRLS